MGALLTALNPLAAVAGLIGDIIKAHKVNEWLKLLVSLGFSCVTSFCFSCGSALVAHRPQWEAFGVGLVSAAIMMTVTWRRSPLTKGLIVALPADEATAEIAENTQVISK